MFLKTIHARVLHDPDTSQAIGDLTGCQTEAYNGAVTLLNRAIRIPKRSTTKNPRGFNRLLTRWRNDKDHPHRGNVPYSVHQTAWEQAWEANQRMGEQADERAQRIAYRIQNDLPLRKRDTRPHRRTLALRHRKSGPTLTIHEGRRLTAKGHTITFGHPHHGFTIRTTRQRLDLLDIRGLQLIPQEDYPPSTPLKERKYLAHIQIAVPGGPPDQLPEVTAPDKILGFDRGVKKNAAASNRAEVVFDPRPDSEQRKKDWKTVRAKRKGSKRRQMTRRKALKNSHKRRERRKASKRDQVKEILQQAQPQAVAVESLRLRNMTASAAGTPEHPGVNVSSKRALNRALAQASLGETNSIIVRESHRLGIPVLPVPAHGTSQTCPRCNHRAKENRESQAVFLCRNCRYLDNADFTSSAIVSNRAYFLYFNPRAVIEDCPTGWPEQPSRGDGRVSLFIPQGETKPKGSVTRPRATGTRVRGPRPPAGQTALPVVAKETVDTSAS